MPGPRIRRGHDVDRRIQVEQRHGNEQRRRHMPEPAAVTAGGALLFFDERRGLRELRIVDGDDGGFRGTRAWVAHWTLTPAASLANSAAALPPEGAPFAPWDGPALLIASPR